MTKISSIGSQSFKDQNWSSPVTRIHRDSVQPLVEMQTRVSHDDDTPGTKASWRSLFAFTERRHIGPATAATFAAALAGLIRPTSSIIFGQLFSALTDYGQGDVDATELSRRMATWCIAITALAAATWILEWAFFSSCLAFGELQAKSVRQTMFAGLLEKNIEWYDLRSDGIASLLTRIETQVNELQLAISQPLGFLVLEAVSILASLGAALYFSWKLSLVILATFPIAAGLFGLVSRGVGTAIERQKRELSRASKYAHTAVAGINTVKAYNGEEQEVWQYFLVAKEISRYYLIQAKANAFQHGVIKFFAVALYVSAFWYGLRLVEDGLSVSHVLTTFVACAYAMQAVEIVLPQFLVLSKGISAGETLKSIKAEMQEGRTTNDGDGDLRPLACAGDIEINNVSFAYPSNPNQNVLNNATFFFPTGEITFLVGTSGSGKSTIGNLLMKFYEAQSGDIFIDNHPIQSLSTDWLRQNMTLVQQQAVLFNGTIEQNIAFGTRESTNEQKIRSAAKDASLEQTIDEMPSGFDTLIGPNYRALSGGQGQRVAIARARLRNAPILILDESTSALDQTSRIEIMERVRTWRKGRTTIIITHDVSQVLENDYVYVLQNARVVQEGYRKALVEKQHGTFAQFVRVAAAGGATGPPSSPINNLPLPPETVDPQGEHTSRWSSISNVFSSHDTLFTNRPQSIYAPTNRVSMGAAMLAQASALREGDHWASPIIPESPVKSSPKPSFMPFMSPIDYPQVPAAAFRSSVHKDYSQVMPGFGNSVSPSRRPSAAIRDRTSKQLEAFLKAASRSDKRIEVKSVDLSVDQKPASLATIARSVFPSLAWNERVHLVVGLIASVMIGAATPVFSWVFTQLLQTFYVTENRSQLAEKWALIMLGIATVDGLSCYCSHYFLEKAAQAWINSLRVESLRRILAQPRSWFDLERNTPSRLTECLDRDAEEMRNILGRFVGIIITIFTMLLITVVWSLAVEWKLTLVALSSAPVMYIVTRLYHWSSAKWEGKSDQARGIISSVFSETFSNIRVVRALTLEGYFNRKHNATIAEGYRIGRTRAVISGCLFGFTDSIIYYVVALVFYYGAVVVISGDTTVTKVFVVINLLTLGTGNAVGMFAMIPQLNTARTTATQVLRLVSLPIDESHESQGTGRLADPFPITFDNLSFTYPSRPHVKTLDGISLSIKPGSCIALVGPSGSGKSTVASLLLGLYPPDAPPGLYSPSTLTFAWKSINTCNIHNIRSHMAIVPQSAQLFPTTIFSNIVYGLSETSPFNNLLFVERAAVEAGIHDFINSLESGYNTLIGEGGQGLSGGQAQRIAIARALVRRPKVLILDEATSALDVESAEGIRDTVKNLRGKNGMAVVIISHNVDMMRIADNVVMIEDGKIVEMGGFYELRRKGGAFESLITGEARPTKTQTTGLGLGVGMDDEDPMTPVKPRMKMEWPTS